MGEQIIKTGNEALERWHKKMPRFFYWIVVISCGILGLAVAINSGVPALGGTLHDWWTDMYSYVVGGCIGVIFVCKFTVAGGYKEIDPDKVIRGNKIVDRDATEPNMSDVETQQPGGEEEDNDNGETSQLIDFR